MAMGSSIYSTLDSIGSGRRSNYLVRFCEQSWRSAYYFSGIIGVVALILLLLLVEEPERGVLAADLADKKFSALSQSPSPIEGIA